MCTILSIFFVALMHKNEEGKELVKNRHALLEIIGANIIIGMIVTHFKCAWRGIRLFFKK